MWNLKEDSIDGRANRYVMHCFCVMMAGFVLAWVLNQLNIFIVNKHTMNLGMLMAMSLFVVCIALCYFMGFDKPNMKYILLFMVIAIVTVIQVMLTYHSVVLSVIPIICSAMYHDTRKMTIYTYFLSAISIILIVFIGYYYGLCDANMALLTSQPLSSYINESGTFLLSRVNTNPFVTLPLYFIFPRCVICWFFVPIVNNISRIIAQSRLKEEEMRILAEIDGMTGLYNRSKYLELVSNTYTAEEKIAVIFWDINGLKRTNDAHGHETGDKLITAVSQSIKDISTPMAKAYRIGGDEFVMIVRGGDEKTVREMVDQWEANVKHLMVNDHVAVSASVGYSCGSGKDLDEIIRRADDMMYENKREFYRVQSVL